MALIGLAIFLGILIASILIFAFYIFPHVVCKFVTDNDNNNTRQRESSGTENPIRGLCEAVS